MNWGGVLIPHKLFVRIALFSLSVCLSLFRVVHSKFLYSLNKMDSTDRSQDICGNFACESISERKKTGFSDGAPSVGTNKPCIKGFVFSYKDYRWYDNRFRSFRNWPKCHPMKAETLAGAGFHYTGKGDKGECDWCKLVLGQWETFNNTFERHKKYSGEDCDFLRQYFPSKSLRFIKYELEALGDCFEPTP